MAILISSGRIAANNSAAVVNSFDEWHAGGGSFNLRPLSRASVNRKLRTRYYMQKMLEISEIFRLIETGEVGFQLSADASSMLGYEMLASALYANGCIFTGRRGLDGLLRPNIFLHKYVSPLLSIESKTARHLAWCLTQILIFWELLPADCSVSDVSKKLTRLFYHYFSDQGSENCGGWRNAYMHGVGGAFLLLFVTAVDDEKIRLAMFDSCTAHDLHNLYGATQPVCGSVRNIHATIRSACKYINLGARHKTLLPLCEYLSGVQQNCPIESADGAMVADEARSALAARWVRPAGLDNKQLSSRLAQRFPTPGETRFASDGEAAKLLGLIGIVLAFATLVYVGGKTKLADCESTLKAAPKGKRKAAKFVSQMTPWENQVFLELVRIRHELYIAPLLRAVERGSHASGPLICGPFGDFRAYRRILERSIVRAPVTQRALDAPIRVRNGGTEQTVQGGLCATSTFQQCATPICKVILLPRWSRWKSVLVMATNAGQRLFITHNIVVWVQAQLSEYDRRLNRQWTRLESLLSAASREYTLVAKPNSPMLNVDALSSPVPSWAVERDAAWGPVSRCRAAHPATQRAACSLQDSVDRRKARLQESYSKTCFAPLLEDPPADLQVHALAPLEIGDHDMPSFPTALEIICLQLARAQWKDLDDTPAGRIEKRAYRWHLHDLLERGKPLRASVDEFCAQSTDDLLDSTQELKPLRYWPALAKWFYKFCTLAKKTAVDNEQIFSIVKCFVLSVRQPPPRFDCTEVTHSLACTRAGTFQQSSAYLSRFRAMELQGSLRMRSRPKSLLGAWLCRELWQHGDQKPTSPTPMNGHCLPQT